MKSNFRVEIANEPSVRIKESCYKRIWEPLIIGIFIPLLGVGFSIIASLYVTGFWDSPAIDVRIRSITFLSYHPSDSSHLENSTLGVALSVSNEGNKPGMINNILLGVREVSSNKTWVFFPFAVISPHNLQAPSDSRYFNGSLVESMGFVPLSISPYVSQDVAYLFQLLPDSSDLFLRKTGSYEVKLVYETDYGIVDKSSIMLNYDPLFMYDKTGLLRTWSYLELNRSDQMRLKSHLW